MRYSLDYKGYLIDHTPFEVEAGVFGPQWTIRKNGGPIGALPFSSGDLGFRGLREYMAEIGKNEAVKWIDHGGPTMGPKRNLKIPLDLHYGK